MYRMKTYLVHTQTIGGHQMEYLHHLYLDALERPDDQFVFVVPARFSLDAAKLEWPEAGNIKIVIMTPDDEVPSGCGILSKGWRNSRTIRKYVRQYHATDVILITIMEYLPFLPLFLNRRIRVCGIVYRIYLYEWQDESRLRKWLDVIKYLLLSRCRVFHRVLMCNDSASSQYLNRLFHTTKFRFMPDPVGALPDYQGHSLREELGISQSDKVFLHPGRMSRMNSYKNTLGILEALCMFHPESDQKPVVIFAGQVSQDIRQDFDALFQKAQAHARLLLLEGFLPFDRMADLFVTCDYVLIPYSVKGQSSGIVGHAAYYEKPVVVVKGGVIGKMVRKWKLGYHLADHSAPSIYSFLCSSLDRVPVSTEGNTYADDHSVKAFCNIVFDDKLN